MNWKFLHPPFEVGCLQINYALWIIIYLLTSSTNYIQLNYLLTLYKIFHFLLMIYTQACIRKNSFHLYQNLGSSFTSNILIWLQSLMHKVSIKLLLGNHQSWEKIISYSSSHCPYYFAVFNNQVGSTWIMRNWSYKLMKCLASADRVKILMM